jgi:hypothetical protein
MMYGLASLVYVWWFVCILVYSALDGLVGGWWVRGCHSLVKYGCVCVSISICIVRPFDLGRLYVQLTLYFENGCFEWFSLH